MSGTESWRTPGNKLALSSAMISFASMVISVFALAASCDAARSGESQAETARTEAARRGLLEVSSVSAYLTDTLKGTVKDGDAPDKQVTGLSGPLVDIAVRNRGSGDALIERVSVNVALSESLSSCWAEGGPLRTTADYKIGIPLSKQPPFTKTENILFTVKAGENDRFTLTVGPDAQDAGPIPWIGVVTIRLQDIDGSDLDIGPIALVDTGEDPHFHPEGFSWKIDKPENPSCMRLNARSVAEVMRIPGITPSKEFAALHRALRPYR